MGNRLRTGGADHARRPSTVTVVGDLLAGWRLRLALLAMTSFGAGLSEALFLVLVTRAIFSITKGSGVLEVWNGHELSIHQAALVAAALVVVRVALALVGVRQTGTLVSGVVARTRGQLSGAFLHASWETQQDDRTGQLQELLTTFTRQGAVLLANLTQMVSSGFSLTALLATAIWVNPLGAIVLIATVALLASLLRPLRKAVKRRSRTLATAGMGFATSLNEISQLGMELHVFGAQDAAERRIAELIERNRVAERRVIVATHAVAPAYIGLAYLTIVGAMVAASFAPAGSLAGLGAVMLVMLRSLTYGQSIQGSHANVVSSLPFLDELRSHLDRYRAGARPPGRVSVGRVGRLQLEDVSFSYVPGWPVLSSLSASIEPAEMVGIVGPSGSGKSTLVQLLLGLREPDSGTILSDGRPIATLSRSEWARHVTFVPQTAHLISGSIRDNIRFFRPGVTDEQIEAAARLAHVEADILGFAGGYDHQVGDAGGRLSGGQRQRICIARALVENPDVLILDEPTSALDARSEHLIRETLTELRQRMAVVIVAHRLSTLESCDRIMVIKDGRMQAFDRPEVLAQTNEFYREALKLSQTVRT